MQNPFLGIRAVIDIGPDLQHRQHSVFWTCSVFGSNTFGTTLRFINAGEKGKSTVYLLLILRAAVFTMTPSNSYTIRPTVFLGMVVEDNSETSARTGTGATRELAGYQDWSRFFTPEDSSLIKSSPRGTSRSQFDGSHCFHVPQTSIP